MPADVVSSDIPTTTENSVSRTPLNLGMRECHRRSSSLCLSTGILRGALLFSTKDSKRTANKRMQATLCSEPDFRCSVLKKEYGKGVRLVDDTETDEELIDIDRLVPRTKARLTPGKNLRIYRQNSKMTQAQLGKMMPSRSSMFRTWIMTFGLSARTWQ